MFKNFNAKKLNVVIGNNSKNTGNPISNGIAKINPISINALIKSKTSFNNLSRRLIRATNTNANLLNKLIAGRIVHNGNVIKVAAILKISSAILTKPLMNVHPQSNAEVIP